MSSVLGLPSRVPNVARMSEVYEGSNSVSSIKRTVTSIEFEISGETLALASFHAKDLRMNQTIEKL